MPPKSSFLKLTLLILSWLPFSTVAVSASDPEDTSALMEGIEDFKNARHAISKRLVSDTVLYSLSPEFASLRDQFLPKELVTTSTPHASDSQLYELASTLSTNHYYSDERAGIAELEMISDHIEDDGKRRKVDFWAHKYLLYLRSFEEADRFGDRHKDHKGLPRAPKVTGSFDHLDGRPVFIQPADYNTLQRKNVTIDDGVIIVSHPHCPFSTRAFSSVEADSTLKELFQQKGVWLSPPSRPITTDTIPLWNAANPEYFHYIVHRKADWPEINYWGTPSFYFFKDGKLVQKTVGWPRDDAGETKAKLLKGFAKIGADICNGVPCSRAD